jgi:hypothetical protein
MHSADDFQSAMVAPGCARPVLNPVIMNRHAAACSARLKQAQNKRALDPTSSARWL